MNKTLVKIETASEVIRLRETKRAQEQVSRRANMIVTPRIKQAKFDLKEMQQSLKTFF